MYVWCILVLVFRITFAYNKQASHRCWFWLHHFWRLAYWLLSVSFALATLAIENNGKSNLRLWNRVTWIQKFIWIQKLSSSMTPVHQTFPDKLLLVPLWQWWLCDGLIPRSEHALALLLCIIQLIPRTKYALASMHYTADTQKSAWCHALCFASWHRCLAYFTLYIALRSFELDYIDCHNIFSEIDIVENVFLCWLFKWRKRKRKRRQEQIGLSGQKGGRGGMISANAS